MGMRRQIYYDTALCTARRWMGQLFSSSSIPWIEFSSRLEVVSAAYFVNTSK